MKKWRWVVGIVSVLALGTWLYMEWTVQRYVLQEDFYGFLVPKSAELFEMNEQAAQYEWSVATFEHGMPLSYQYALKKKGWRKLAPIDTIQVFEKGQQQIHVVMTTDYLGITKTHQKPVMLEPEPTDWVTYSQPIRAYMYYRTQAVLHNDIDILWAQYPALQQAIDLQQGINVEQEELTALNNGLTLLDANYDIESYKRMKVHVVNNQQVIVQIHGSVMYIRDDFEESGGEYVMDIYLEKQGSSWTVIKTDSYTEAEYKDLMSKL